jgi:hypothetical protein
VPVHAADDLGHLLLDFLGGPEIPAVAPENHEA